MRRKLFVKARKVIRARKEETDSSESNTEVNLVDTDSDPDPEKDDDIIEGDFVVVKVHGKVRSVNYVARVDVVGKDDEYSGFFLKKLPTKGDEIPTFVIDDNDNADWNGEDMVKKLPQLKVTGTSNRPQYKFSSLNTLQKWILLTIMMYSHDDVLSRFMIRSAP